MLSCPGAQRDYFQAGHVSGSGQRERRSLEWLPKPVLLYVQAFTGRSAGHVIIHAA